MNEHLPGSKIAERLFSRPEGATMAEIVAATGGRQHNLLERLKARGYAVRSRKEGRTTRYWATPPGLASYELTVSVKGQMTLPKEIRDRLFIRPGGGKLTLSVEPNGNIALSRRVGSIESLCGILGKPKRSLSIEQMDEAIHKAVLQRYLRTAKRK